MIAPEERVRILQESKPNSWIALAADESRVVGRGNTYAEAVEQAKRQGEEDPVLLKIPDDWSIRAFLSCK